MFLRSLSTVDLRLKSQLSTNDKFWPRVIRNYTSVRAEKHAIAKNRDNFTIKSNIWDQKVNCTIVKPHCLNPPYSRTPCIFPFSFNFVVCSRSDLNIEIQQNRSDRKSKNKTQTS